jgi:drug/metabolite transporter (DMT)-like permease
MAQRHHEFSSSNKKRNNGMVPTLLRVTHWLQDSIIFCIGARLSSSIFLLFFYSISRLSKDFIDPYFFIVSTHFCAASFLWCFLFLRWLLLRDNIFIVLKKIDRTLFFSWIFRIASISLTGLSFNYALGFFPIYMLNIYKMLRPFVLMVAGHVLFSENISFIDIMCMMIVTGLSFFMHFYGHLNLSMGSMPLYVYFVPFLGVVCGALCDIINRYVSTYYKQERNHQKVDSLLFLTLCISGVTWAYSLLFFYEQYDQLLTGQYIFIKNIEKFYHSIFLAGLCLFFNNLFVSWTLNKIDLYTIGLLISSNQAFGFLCSILFLKEYPGAFVLSISFTMVLVTLFSSLYREHQRKKK